MTRSVPRWTELVLPVGIVACLLVILVPLPPALMDLLLVANITVAVIILLSTIYIRTPMELSVFPSLLLATTLARLVLNVATTRLILSRGSSDQTGAAGQVVQSFGEFVAGNQIIVGVIIFAIIVVIQYVVITKGATRISEVAARFALDGLPGRQMAIDADLSAGLIKENEARARREELHWQADFYGAMDGASKFVRGDAIAGIFIIVINIVGGMVIGLSAGMSVPQAASTFTTLTIGDGLVSQIPAFLIALAAGMLVTRSGRSVNLPAELLRQILNRPVVLLITAVFLATLAFTRLPAIPLLLAGGACAALAYMLTRQPARAGNRSTTSPAEPLAKAAEPIEKFLAVDPVQIELGVGLISLADSSRGGDLLRRITQVRQSLASDLGVVLPKVRVRDDLTLGRHEYRINLNHIPFATGTAPADKLLALETDGSHGVLPGETCSIELQNRPAIWIAPDDRDQASSLGYRVLEAAEMIAAHLSDIVFQNSDQLLTREATAQLVEELRKTAPSLVDELVPKTLSLGQIQQVLQALLVEGVSIRPLAQILETLSDYAEQLTDPGALAERVRLRLAPHICARLQDTDGVLRVFRLDGPTTNLIQTRVQKVPSAPDVLRDLERDLILSAVQKKADGLQRRRHHVLLVDSAIRRAVWGALANRAADFAVIGDKELGRELRLEVLATVGCVLAHTHAS